MDKFVFRLRGLFYKLGFKPKYGSVFYSPSMAMMNAVRDVNLDAEPLKGLSAKDITALGLNRPLVFTGKSIPIKHKHDLFFVGRYPSLLQPVGKRDEILVFECMDCGHTYDVPENLFWVT